MYKVKNENKYNINCNKLLIKMTKILFYRKFFIFCFQYKRRYWEILKKNNKYDKRFTKKLIKLENL